MYKELHPGEEYEILKWDTCLMIMNQINKDVLERYELDKVKCKDTLGCLAWHDIKLNDGTIAELYIEYIAEFIDDKIFFAYINYAAIFDGMPDIILDRISEVKKQLVPGTIKS